MDKIWDLKSAPNYFLNEIESFEFKEHKEDKVVVDQKETAKYEFNINDVNDNILYSDGYVAIELKIVKQDDSNITNENVTLVNTGNIFSRAELYVSKTLVEEIEYPSLVHHVNGLINFTSDYAASEATNMLFYPDTSEFPDKQFLTFDGADDQTIGTRAKMNEFLVGLKENAKYNRGFTKRYILTKNSNLVRAWFPLKQLFGFFNDFRKLIANIDVKLTFHRSSSDDMLYTDSSLIFKVIISNVTLWLPHVRLNPEYQVKYNNLALNPLLDTEISFCSIRMIQSNIQNSSNGSIIVNTTSNEIKSIFVFARYQEKEADQQQNNMIFDNLDLLRCWIRINNDKYPSEDYDVSFKAGEFNYNRYYSDFLAAGLNNINTESGCLVSYENYGRLYPIIHFDVSNHPPYINVSNLKVEFHWQLRSTPSKPYRFYFMIAEKRKALLNMFNRSFTTLKTIN